MKKEKIIERSYDWYLDRTPAPAKRFVFKDTASNLNGKKGTIIRASGLGNSWRVTFDDGKQAIVFPSQIEVIVKK
jgi:hypothetical protein